MLLVGYIVMIRYVISQVAGILDFSLAKAGDLIIKHVITPAVNYQSPVTFVEDVTQGTEGIKEAELKILPSQDCKVTTLYQ